MNEDEMLKSAAPSKPMSQQKTGQVEEQLALLQTNLNRFYDNLERLVNKLRPVLRDNCPDDPSDVSDVDGLCGLAVVISEKKNSLFLGNKILENLLDRLEI